MRGSFCGAFARPTAEHSALSLKRPAFESFDKLIKTPA
jgi:hypothetical protein